MHGGSVRFKQADYNHAMQTRLRLNIPLLPILVLAYVARTLPYALAVLWPVLRAIPAYAVGVGVRPEHVRTKDAHTSLRA